MTVLRRLIAGAWALALVLVLTGCELGDPRPFADESGPAQTVSTVVPAADVTATSVTCEYADQGVARSATIDVYEPDIASLPEDAPAPYAADGSRPVAVYFHGGEWKSGGLGSFDGAGGGAGRPIRAQLERGWVVVAATYRLAPANPWPSQIVDAKAAVNCARDITGLPGIASTVDQSRVVVAGGSAGGHLATLVGLSAGTWEPTAPAAISPTSAGGAAPGGGTRVTSVVNFDGPTDLRSLWREPPLPIGERDNRPMLRELFCGDPSQHPDCDDGDVHAALDREAAAGSPSPIDWVPTSATGLPSFYLACGTTIPGPSQPLVGILGPSFVECADHRAFYDALLPLYSAPATAPLWFDDTRYKPWDTDHVGPVRHPETPDACVPGDIRYTTDNGTPSVPGDDEEWCAVNHLIMERRVNQSTLDLFLDQYSRAPA